MKKNPQARRESIAAARPAQSEISIAVKSLRETMAAAECEFQEQIHDARDGGEGVVIHSLYQWFDVLLEASSTLVSSVKSKGQNPLLADAFDEAAARMDREFKEYQRESATHDLEIKILTLRKAVEPMVCAGDHLITLTCGGGRAERQSASGASQPAPPPKISFRELEIACYEAADLLDSMAMELAEFIEEHTSRPGKGSGLLSLAFATSRKLMKEFHTVHGQAKPGGAQ